MPKAGLAEPSGLDAREEPGLFWTVSDGTAALIALQAETLSAQVAISHDIRGIEGVARGWDSGIVLMVHEQSNSLVWLNSNATGSPHSLPISKLKGFDAVAKHFASNAQNKGLEGIAVDRARQRVFVVKEGQPRVLLEISSDLDRIVDHTVLKKDLGFHVKGLKDHKLDISGLFYDSNRNALWMASDRGECVFLYDLQSKTAQRIEIVPHTRKLPDLKGIEGISLNEDGSELFLVSDAGKKSSFIRLALINE
ncbi:SdiA-regulated domain-containing protein [uncultured Shimia sp.]|uniref:SdiA-regulated domain-containing protein n=1 Tax=uncultured Shimia sp. TaxID=573152 RepID=UPI0026070CC6|nr:SdiA-regulated domain-containing protein [uncultured Shimia sp.]